MHQECLGAPAWARGPALLVRFIATLLSALLAGGLPVAYLSTFYRSGLNWLLWPRNVITLSSILQDGTEEYLDCASTDGGQRLWASASWLQLIIGRCREQVWTMFTSYAECHTILSEAVKCIVLQQQKLNARVPATQPATTSVLNLTTWDHSHFFRQSVSTGYKSAQFF
jgi:hypothetical protein